MLQRISGVPFPRGTGLVTRCATQIRMSHGKTRKADIRAGEDAKSEIIMNRGDITEKIQEATDKLCPVSSKAGLEGAQICADEMIEIQLQSPGAPDLTFIDLPGIVRTTTKGQSKNVIAQVDNLLSRYLKQKRKLVLAVIPADADIATAEILERAAQYDPDGSRIMGVLTKPDLVNPGSEEDVLAVLQNETKPIKHGYFMLKNPSQKESGALVSQEEARRIELEWFAQSKFVDRGGENLGVEALTSALTTLLVGQIEEDIPAMRKEIEGLLSTAQKSLRELGAAAPNSAKACREDVGSVIRGWSASMHRVLESNYDDLEKNDDDKYLVAIEHKN